MVGMGVGPCRLPLCEMSAKNREYVAGVLKQYDLSAIDAFFK